MHAHFALAADRGLGDLCAHTAIGFHESDAARDALCCRLVPPRLLSCRVEHGEPDRIFAQQFAAILVRILPGSVGHLVDKALPEEAVLRMIDRAPEAHGHMGRAHRVADLVVRHRIGHFVGEAVGERLIDAARQPLREQIGEDRWAGDPHPPRDRHARSIEAGGELGHRRRTVEVVADVLLARP